MFPSSLFLIILVLISLFLSLLATSSSSTILSPADRNGEYSLNFSVSLSSTVTQSTPPSATDATPRTVVIYVDFELARLALDNQKPVRQKSIDNVTISFPNRTTAEQNLLQSAGIFNFPKIENYLTLKTSALTINDPSHGRNILRQRVEARFVIPIMKFDATEANIFAAIRKFDIIVRGLPRAANVSTIFGVSFQFQKLSFLRAYKTPNRNYFLWESTCRVNNAANSGFLLTFIKKGEEAMDWIRSSGAEAVMNTSKATNYWIGGTSFDNRNIRRNLCWVTDPFYSSEICNSSASLANDNIENNTLFTYVSAASTWKRGELFCRFSSAPSQAKTLP